MVREDAAYLLQPYYQFAADEVRAGRFPHWNPFAMCGLPFHATLQGAVLYPLRWPMFWTDYARGYALMLWVHYFLAALFTFIFIRTTLKCRPIPALVGAISFAFGGFTLGHVSHPNYFLSYPWFVLTILLLSQAVERRRWVWAIAAGIPVGLMALAGSVHLLLLLAFGLGLWVVGEMIAALVGKARLGQPNLIEAFRPALAVVIAFVLGGALAAAQILPAGLQMELSSRADVGWDFITEISAHPLRTLIRLVAPFYWGNYRLGYWGENYFHENCFYTGIIPLIAAVAAVAMCMRNRWAIRLAVLCVVAALVAAGRFLPVYWLLYKIVPMFDRLRDPARLLWWVQFGIACLAAIGLNRMAEADAEKIPRRAVVASLVAGATVVVIILGCLMRLGMLARDPGPTVDAIRQLEPANRAEQARRASAVQHMPRLLMHQGDTVTWLGIAAAIFSAFVVCGVIVHGKKLTLVGGGVLVALLALDLGAFSGGMVHYSTMDNLVLDTPAHARYLQEHLGTDRYLCLLGRGDEVSLHRGMLFRIRHAMAGGGGIFHTARQDKMIHLLWQVNRRLLNLAGVRYLVMTRPVKARGIRPVFRADEVCINENLDVYPRALLARQVRVIEDPNAMLVEILGGKSDLLDVALVEQPIDPLPQPGSGDRERGEVVITRADPGRFEMRTDAPGPRQLVVTETYHPQWQCLIDGEPAPVRQTDWTFMSVRVPAGAHHVTVWFEPTRFKQGMTITLVALAIVVGTLVVSGVRGRRAEGVVS